MLSAGLGDAVAQCTTGAQAGTLNPISPVYQTLSIPGGVPSYYNFSAVAGGSYTFTYCSNGGSYTGDPYLTIATTVPAALQANDDFCGLGSQITWTCPTTGTYRLYVSGCCPCSNAPAATLAYGCASCAPPSPPTISSFSPLTACGGSTPVTIFGNNFTGTTSVTFGGTPALSFIVNSNTQITATPGAAGNSGLITVSTAGGSGSSPSSININPAPSVSCNANPATLCQGAPGGNSTLTATGNASSYLWNPGNLNGAVQTVTPVSTTIYTVTASSALGCTAISTVTVNVTAQPSVTISQNPANPICGVNPVLTANASGGGAGAPASGARWYVRDADPWATPNNTNAMNAVFGPANWTQGTFSTPAATIFQPSTQFVFLEGSDANASALNTFVTANITTIQNWVNAGGRLFLNAAPNQGGNMSWGFGGVTLNYTAAQSSVSAVNPSHPIFTGPFTPTATTLTGNSYSHAHITGGSTTSILSGGGVTVLSSLLWGNGMALFGGITSPNYHQPAVEAQNVWQNIINYTANAAVAPVYTYNWQPGGATTSTLTASTNGVYTVTVTAAGCPATATTSITINPAITVNASASLNPICANANTQLSATGANTYLWQPGNLSGSSVTVNPAATTTYTVTGTAATGCTATSVITINVTALPPTVSGSATPNPVCAGSATTLTGSGTAVSYTWTGAVPVTNGLPFIPPATGTYTVTGLAANGCTATATVLVNVANLPAVGINVTPNDTVCLNNNITLSGTGASTYSWAGSVQNGVAFPATGNSVYTVTGQDALGCTNTATIAITVNALPSVFVASVVPNDTLCDGSFVTLTAGGTATTYNWTNPVQNGVPFNPPAGNNTYGLVGTDGNGCQNFATQLIVVNTNPSVSANVSPNDTVCANSQVTLSGSGASTYAWTGGVTNNTPFSIAGSGNYTVTGTDANGCTGTQSIALVTTPGPAITITKNPATGVVCGSNPVVLTAAGASTYVWTGNTVVNNGQFFYPPASGVYTVIATDANNCSVTSTANVTVSTLTGNLALTVGANLNSVSGSSITSYNQPAGSITSYYNAACNLICRVELGPATYLGNISAQVVVASSVLNYNGQPYLRRRFVISPPTNGPAVNVTLPVIQADFNSYNLASPGWPQMPINPTDIAGMANIRITKLSGGGLGVGTPEVITPTVNWNGSFWEISFPVSGFSEFYIHGVNPGNVPLPVTLSNFQGEKTLQGNLLSWTTTHEQNNDFFTLERSRDGLDFSPLTIVPTKAMNGSSQGLLHYSFLDVSPLSGHNYYRLVQTDVDGHNTQHAKIVDLTWNNTGHHVSLYPNPTRDVLNIELFTERAQLTRVQVLDLSGRTVRQLEQRIENGLRIITLDLRGLAAGVYTVQVFENGSLSHVGKVNVKE